MDLTRDVTYRSFLLNDSAVKDNVTGGGYAGNGISGCVIDSVDFSDVDVIQFLEKRSLQDGMDAGDVFLGSRRIRMAGTLYDISRPALFDSLLDLRAALSPVLAQREEPADKGYQPLYFSLPTTRTSEFTSPLGIIDMRVLALPRAFQSTLQRDQTGGEDDDAGGLVWQATFLCKDPALQGAAPVDVTIDGDLNSSFANRGSYLAPLDMLIVVDDAAGSILVTAGDSNFTITVPASTVTRTIRFKGRDKELTFQDLAGAELPRYDLLTFNGATTWPLLPPTATVPYTVTFTTSVPQTGSHMWFYEHYA